jgi:hypothetical protein
MRAVFSILGLVIVVAVIGVLAKKQLGSVPAPPVTATGSPDTGVRSAPAATPRQQVEQIKQSVDAAAAQPRALPDEAK